MKPGMEVLAISLGGACGALLRYYIAVASKALITSEFSWGTFAANVLGCFLIGLMIGSQRDQNETIRLGFGIGFLGSLTTFSTFSAQTINHLTGGNWMLGTINAVANLTCCLLATVAGITLGRRLLG